MASLPVYVTLSQFLSRFYVWGMWLGSSLYSYIPTVLLFTFNISITVLLIRSSRMADGQQDKSNIRATKTTLTVSFTYLLLTLPSVTFIALNSTGAVTLNFDTHKLINRVMNTLLLANPRHQLLRLRSHVTLLQGRVSILLPVR